MTLTNPDDEMAERIADLEQRVDDHLLFGSDEDDDSPSMSLAETIGMVIALRALLYADEYVRSGKAREHYNHAAHAAGKARDGAATAIAHGKAVKAATGEHIAHTRERARTAGERVRARLWRTDADAE